jgi:UDP-GlcNAc:undecaprenyl-phosphate/decaprenyl-phosphate GlcNAc-1-phosphate transferase
MISIPPPPIPKPPNLHPAWIQVAVAVPVALALGYVARIVGPRLGALDRPDDSLKPHARAVTYLGGVAVAAGLAAGVATRGWPLRAGVTAALFGALALGLADDALRVPAVARLALQVGLGAVMVTGLNIAVWHSPVGLLYGGAAVVLYAAALNAVNMVDGMDGLAGGLAALSGAGIVVIAITETDHHPGIVAACLVGAVLGFLIHNLPPARLFLGDNGSYFVGAALAVAVLQAGRSVPELAGAAGCLGLFLVDLVLALARRVTGRVPLSRGDRGHLYDQLLARGRSVWATLGICGVAQAALVGAGVIAAQLSTTGALVVQSIVWAAAIGALFALGFVTYRQETPVG